MIGYIIQLVGCMSPFWSYALTHILALAFVATVPCILRKLVAIYV